MNRVSYRSTLQTFQSDRQSTHSSLCEVLQSASVTLTSEDEASCLGDAAVAMGTCNVPITGNSHDVMLIVTLTVLTRTSFYRIQLFI